MRSFGCPNPSVSNGSGGGALPSWLTAEDARYLSGGVTEADVTGSASLEGFVSGEFQQAVENEVGNYIPGKAAALLGNASVQRNFIDASNVLFQFDCVPTYFGSKVVDVPSAGRLIEKTGKATTRVINATKAAAEALEVFAGRHPGQRVLVYLVADSLIVEDSPVAQQVTQAMTYKDYADIFQKEGNSYTWIDGDVAFSDFDEGWFKTDHHWNIRGALGGYKTIAGALGFGGELLDVSDVMAYDQPIFRGTFARRGLDSRYDDFILDCQSSLPPFAVEVNGREETLDFLAGNEAYGSGRWDANEFSSRYGEYFHGDYGLITIENLSPEAEGELLIVADSNSNCMERFLAAHYRTTYIFDPRYADEGVDHFLAEHPAVNDVLVMMNAGGLVSETTLEAFEE